MREARRLPHPDSRAVEEAPGPPSLTSQDSRGGAEEAKRSAAQPSAAGLPGPARREWAGFKGGCPAPGQALLSIFPMVEQMKSLRVMQAIEGDQLGTLFKQGSFGEVKPSACLGAGALGL